MLANARQLELFPSRLKMFRFDETCNMRRYYLMTVQADLFGGVNLVRQWGRIGTAGRVALSHFEDERGAISALVDLAQAKRKRGYQV